MPLGAVGGGVGFGVGSEDEESPPPSTDEALSRINVSNRSSMRSSLLTLDIQETLLPPSVHIYPKKKAKMSKQLDTNGGITRQDGNNDELSLNTGSTADNTGKEINNEDFSPSSSTVQSKVGQRPLSPYSNVRNSSLPPP
ncbi:hypothetical protein DH2020_000801 [Rehmannia glutinosa]|uniref:Uncharacterized protein n=1 Tax=Rehmannia glutinosa TaxID=99300 RepID=A0ABR0XXN6_REHGL